MDSEPHMTCDEALGHLASFLDGELHGAPHEALERHLEICRGCFSRAEFERRLKAEIGRLRRDEVPGTFQDRVRRLLRSFATTATEPSDNR